MSIVIAGRKSPFDTTFSSLSSRMKLDGKRLFCGCYPLKCRGKNYLDAIDIIKSGNLSVFGETDI